VGLHELGDVDAAEADRVTYANVRELALFAEAVDRRRAYAEALGHFAHGKQRFGGTPGGKML